MSHNLQHRQLGLPATRARRKGKQLVHYNYEQRHSSTRALRTSDGTLCTLQADCAQKYQLVHGGTSFHEYLQQIELRLPQFELPLGAAVSVMPDGNILLTVPKVTFMDLWVLPSTELAVMHGHCMLEIRATNTTVTGSHHVANLRCNDRFELALRVRLLQEDDRCAHLHLCGVHLHTCALNTHLNILSDLALL